MLLREALYGPVSQEIGLLMRVTLLTAAVYFAADFLKRFGFLKSICCLIFIQRTGEPSPLVGIGILLVMGDAITVHGENVRKWCI